MSSSQVRHKIHIKFASSLTSCFGTNEPFTFTLAAHCFTNLQTGQLLPFENYDIAAGKYYIDIDDVRDVNVQHARVSTLYFNNWLFLLNSLLLYLLHSPLVYTLVDVRFFFKSL